MSTMMAIVVDKQMDRFNKYLSNSQSFFISKIGANGLSLHMKNVVWFQRRVLVGQFIGMMHIIDLQSKHIIEERMLSRILNKKVMSFSTINSLSVDLTRYLTKGPGWEKDCEKVVKDLYKCGFFYAHDPRIQYEKNDRFLDELEHYFALRSRQFEEGITNLDVCVGNLKVGLKENYSQFRGSYAKEKERLTSGNLALTPVQPKVDPTWRYHWLLNSQQNVKPIDFPNFPEILNSWGKQLYDTNFTVCEMIAVGLGLDFYRITDTMKNGSHYISPPAVDLSKSKPGDVITGFHRDFGLITAMARTRFPGLMAWLLTGEKVDVNIPEDHILIQSGKQLQWLTGGYLKAGFHEVIHTSAVQAQVKHNLRSGKSTWRVVPSLFSYVEGSHSLEPFDAFIKEGTSTLYPSITAEEYLLKQLAEDAKRAPKQK